MHISQGGYIVKKHVKKLVSLFLAILMLATLLPATSLADSLFSEFVLKVNPFGNEESSIDTIEWYKDGLNYYLFLPAECDTSALTVYFNGGNTIKVYKDNVFDAVTLHNGDTTDVFEPYGTYHVISGIITYKVKTMSSSNIPSVYIETESGSLDYIHASKDNKEAADIRIYDDGEIQLDSPLKQIKGRGNATWNYEKKPYNIKFDSKTSVLGMDKAKKWSMLASYVDPSIVRNPLAWYLADELGLFYGSDYRIVDLYINGEYMGNYIICESVEVGKNRVNIFDLTGATEAVNSDDLENYPVGGTGEGGTVQPGSVYPSSKWVNIPNDPADITGGYLLECELNARYNDEISGFVTSRAQAVVVKEPECASKAQVEYISSYWQEAEDAVCSPDGYNALGKHYSEYFDMESLVNMYIMFEFSNNIDSGITSTYFCKNTNGKLVASPVWDFDRSLGDDFYRLGVYFNNPAVWTANRLNTNCNGYAVRNVECPSIFNLLYRHEDFRQLVSTRWSEIGSTLGGADTVSFICNLAFEIEASAIMNGVRWDGPDSISTYEAEVTKAINFVTERTQWLDKGFAADAPQLYYDVNGGTGWMVDCNIYSNGDSAVVKGLTADGDAAVYAPAGNHPFLGWNTEADGSGTTYAPGSTIVLGSGTTTLYAQWKDNSAVDPDDPDKPDKPDDPGKPTTGEKIKDFIINNRVSTFIRDSFNTVSNFFKGLFK